MPLDTPPTLPRRLAACTLVAVLLAASAAHAQSWSEQGDAGDLPGTAQVTIGASELSSISGTLSSDADVDMYCIRVTDAAAFAAWLNCLVIVGNDVLLFDSNGVGVARDRGCQGGQTRVGAPLVTSIGVHYLAIAGHDSRALHGTSDLWNPSAGSGQSAPDGPAAAQPVTGWAPGPIESSSYVVRLVGATFCDFVLPARGASWGGLKTIYR